MQILCNTVMHGDTQVVIEIAQVEESTQGTFRYPLYQDRFILCVGYISLCSKSHECQNNTFDDSSSGSKGITLGIYKHIYSISYHGRVNSKVSRKKPDYDPCVQIGKENWARYKFLMIKENNGELCLGFTFSGESKNEYKSVKPNYLSYHYESERHVGPCLSRRESFLISWTVPEKQNTYLLQNVKLNKIKMFKEGFKKRKENIIIFDEQTSPWRKDKKLEISWQNPTGSHMSNSCLLVSSKSSSVKLKTEQNILTCG